MEWKSFLRVPSIEGEHLEEEGEGERGAASYQPLAELAAQSGLSVEISGLACLTGPFRSGQASGTLVQHASGFSPLPGGSYERGHAERSSG